MHSEIENISLKAYLGKESFLKKVNLKVAIDFLNNMGCLGLNTFISCEVSTINNHLKEKATP